MSKNLEILNNDDVISMFKHDEGRFASGDTLKVQQLLKEYENYLEGNTKSTSNSEICTQGIECEVLKQDGNIKGWRKGKIKFVIQFETDEITNNINSLDDIRHRIHGSD
jgi:hypothetical protein